MYMKKFKTISEEERKRCIELFNSYELSPVVEEFAKKFEKTMKRRDMFLWKWMGATLEYAVTLETVEKKYRKSAIDAKLLLTILDTILDDVADAHKNKELLEKMILTILTNIPQSNNPKVKLAHEVWNTILEIISAFPRYNEFKEVFIFDVKQMLNTMHYSVLVNTHPKIVNFLESCIYVSHNMICFSMLDIDLMASPSFDMREFGKFREIVWYAQQMARIGNWITTWKRELKDRDFTSGVFSFAVSHGIISAEEIARCQEDEIAKRIEENKVKEKLLDIWWEYYDKIEELGKDIYSINIPNFLRGMRKLLKFHLASEGLK